MQQAPQARPLPDLLQTPRQLAPGVTRTPLPPPPQFGPTPTLLHEAAHRGAVGCARLLLERGADKDAKDRVRRAPLFADRRERRRSGRRCSFPFASSLAPQVGNTPLHLAVARANETKGTSYNSNHVAVIEVLLEKGADKDAVNDVRPTPSSYPSWGVSSAAGAPAADDVRSSRPRRTCALSPPPAQMWLTPRDLTKDPAILKLLRYWPPPIASVRSSPRPSPPILLLFCCSFSSGGALSSA